MRSAPSSSLDDDDDCDHDELAMLHLSSTLCYSNGVFQVGSLPTSSK